MTVCPRQAKSKLNIRLHQSRRVAFPVRCAKPCDPDSHEACHALLGLMRVVRRGRLANLLSIIKVMDGYDITINDWKYDINKKRVSYLNCKVAQGIGSQGPLRVRRPYALIFFVPRDFINFSLRDFRVSRATYLNLRSFHENENGIL